MNYIWIGLISYIAGSIPSGLIIGKTFCGVDIREHGSKNIGATNVFRVLGPWPAFWVFAADLLKGVAGVLAGQFLDGSPVGMLIGGIGAITGHNCSVFLKFKGGRGVATGLGVIAVLAPKVTGIVFVTWALIVYISRFVSLASIIAAALVPPFMYWLYPEPEYFYFGLAAAAFVIIRHRPNIIRLLHGEEPKIKPGGKLKSEEGKQQP